MVDKFSIRSLIYSLVTDHNTVPKKYQMGSQLLQKIQTGPSNEISQLPAKFSPIFFEKLKYPFHSGSFPAKKLKITHLYSVKNPNPPPVGFAGCLLRINLWGQLANIIDLNFYFFNAFHLSNFHKVEFEIC